MDFAPYQDESPDTSRALSPPPPAYNRPQSPPHKPVSPALHTDPWGYSAQHERASSPDPFERDVVASPHAHGAQEDRRQQQQGVAAAGRPTAFGNGVGADERNVDVYSTSLPMRLDYEACMAYILLPPAGAAILLIFEHRSDYVRFHAWQSGLVFTFLFVLHIIFSFTAKVSFLLLAMDLTLIALLVYHAYKDADTLDRYELPFFGRIASSFVDDE